MDLRDFDKKTTAELLRRRKRLETLIPRSAGGRKGLALLMERDMIDIVLRLRKQEVV